MRFNVADSKGDIWIHSVIGQGFFSGISSEDVANALKEMGDVDEIIVHINSQGGSVRDGMGIYNLLKKHEATIKVEIDGIAASAASFVAMAGDEIEIAENGLLMIHNPRTFFFGDRIELQKELAILDKHKSIIVSTYSSRTDHTRNEIDKMMDEETWFTAKEALEEGFVDSISKNKAKPPENSNVKNWSDFMNSLKKEFHMSDVKNKVPEKTADPEKKKEPTVTDPENKVETPPVEPKLEKTDPQNADPKNKTGDAPVDSNDPVMEERSRISKIDALCEMAEVSDENRRSFIQNNFTVEETQNAIKDILGKKNAVVPEGGEQPQSKKKDPDQKYRDEYNEHKEIYQQSGTTVEDYIESRKIDDGEAQLQDPRTHLPVASEAA